MTRDEIIRMAREAGFANVRGGLMDNGELSDYWDCWPDQLARFAALVAASEREACAEKTGRFARKWWSIHCASNKHMETTRKAHDDFCALQVAIRARGNE